MMQYGHLCKFKTTQTSKNMKTKIEKLKKLIFKQYGQHSGFDKLEYRMLREHTMLSKHKSFKRLSVKSQFDILVTVELMIIHRETASIRRDMPISGKQDTSELIFDPEYNFKEKEQIDITETNNNLLT